MTAEFLMEWVCHNASRIRASASLGKSIEDWLHIELAREIQTRGWTPAAEIPLPVGKESVDLLYLVGHGLYCMVEIKVQSPEDENKFGGSSIWKSAFVDLDKLVRYANSTGFPRYNNYYLMIVTLHEGWAPRIDQQLAKWGVSSQHRIADNRIGVVIAQPAQIALFGRPKPWPEA